MVIPPPGSVNGSGTIVIPPENHTGAASGTVVLSPQPVSRAAEAGDDDRTVVPGVVSGAADGGPLAPDTQFGTRYRIIKLLGVGGMGAVYQAWDEELGVVVALKVVRPEIAADPAAAAELERRFKRELLLARQVTHPNVVRIHDLGEINGIKYITMPFIDGEDLSTILQREGLLAAERAIRIMRTMLAGLVAAHQAGVVHRDLKPANVMIDADDQAMIMDFGIARTSGHGEARARTARTGTGLSAIANFGQTAHGAIVGTIEYMAPEQARDEEVDERADVYAFGLICYDMLVGRTRHERVPSAFNELLKRITAAPPPPRSVNPAVPEAIDAIVNKCLQPDPAARFQTSAELAESLAALDDHGVPLPKVRKLTWRVMAGVGILTAALIAGTYFMARGPEPTKSHPPVSVLVSDFVDKTNNPVFRGSLEQALTAGIEGASFITAYPRRDALQLANQIKAGSRLDAEMTRLVAAREGIKLILAGRVDRQGSDYAVKVDAIDPTAGKVVATANQTAASPERILAALGSAAIDLREALGDTPPDTARASAAETVTAGSLAALSAYSRAQDLQAARDDNAALEAYREAIRLDPQFGRAYAGMGVVYWNLGDEEKAKASYDKAMQLVNRMTDREKYRTLGSYYMFIARNYEKAVENFEALVKLYPADDAGHGNLSIAYLFTGDLRRAIEQARKALDLNPKSTSDRYNYAIYSLYAADFDTAVREGTRLAKESPGFPPGGLLPAALATLLKGDRDGAIARYQQLAELGDSQKSLARFGRIDLQMYLGQYRTALAAVQEAIAEDQKADAPGRIGRDHVAAAEAYLALGQTARAVAAARKAASLAAGNESIAVPAALALVELGRPEEAEKIAATLENTLQNIMTAYARIISAEVALRRDRNAEAIDLFRDSIKKRDTWLARFLLGRLYARTEHYPEALAELDACLKRRGESADVFFADTPTARYLPPALYWIARTHQALGVGDAGKLYGDFLALRGAAVPPDPLALDARKRLATLPQ